MHLLKRKEHDKHNRVRRKEEENRETTSKLQGYGKLQEGEKRKIAWEEVPHTQTL